MSSTSLVFDDVMLHVRSRYTPVAPATAPANAMPSLMPLSAPGWIGRWNTGSVPQTTRLPTAVLPPAVVMTAEVHVARFDSTDGAIGIPQVGSPMMSTWYFANCAAVIASHCAPVT